MRIFRDFSARSTESNGGLMEPNGILIYAELTNDFNVKTVVKELVTKALELKAKIWNQRIMACVIGSRIQYDSITEELGKY